MSDYKTIAESNNFIVLDKYTREWKVAESYQSESDLERELIQDLVHQGYEFLSDLNTPGALLANVRVQLQALNSAQFSDAEWQRFVETWLDRPSDDIVEKTRRIHDNHVHDFVFDDGRIQNIYLLDKKNIARNKVQVIKQFEQTGTQANRYDVTVLVNGLPLVQVELKKRGVAIREAFNQVHRYSKVLKFKVDYNDVRPRFKAIEAEQDEKKLGAAENKQALLHPDRIREITQYILNNYRQKTHRLQPGGKGFNAMFAVSSVDAAKLYYESFRELQKGVRG